VRPTAKPFPVNHRCLGTKTYFVADLVKVRHHVQHGSAKHSVKGGLAFLWEMRFLTPYSSAPNEPIKMAFGTRDYVMETTPPANFHRSAHFGYPLERGEISPQNVCPFFFVCSSISTHSDHRGRPIFTINAPYDVVRC